MAPLIRWGLPTSRHNDLLFGGQPPWSATQYNAAPDVETLRTRDAGADTDLNPLPQPEGLLLLTTDEGARAEILRRYRLYSRQPDEMIVLRALQRMNPGRLDFDPRLYQYGGGYIYLVGATLRAGALLRMVHLSRDIGVYLERPEKFARFYVVARAVSLVFGALTLLAVWKLARRVGGRLAGWIAMVGVAAAPVFFTAVLEAKPHLPSACLILWATLSAVDFQRSGRWTAALRLGWQAGYAVSLVLTGLAAALLWPVLLLTAPLRSRQHATTRLVAAGGIALAVWAACNPYVPYNLLTGRAALASNIRNSAAMYQDQVRRASQGAAVVARLLAESTGLAVPFVGVLGLAGLIRRHGAAVATGTMPGLGMLVLCVLIGAGKPAEFARFLILPVLLLNVASAHLLAALVRRRPVAGVASTILVLGLMRTPAYFQSFLTDARGNHEARLLAGRFLAENMEPRDALGVLQEPAPYAVPPLDFPHRAVWLMPKERPARLDPAGMPEWLVYTADDARTHAGAWWQAHYSPVRQYPPPRTDLSPITWANKPTFVLRRNP